jgi:hypothetical protein
VTFEETGIASIGKVQFAAGSIEPTAFLLNLEHDRTRRIGTTLSMTADKSGIDAVFKIVETTAGNDSLIEASTGMRDGFSVEVSFDEYETVKDSFGVLPLRPPWRPRKSVTAQPTWLDGSLNLRRG